MSVVFTLPLFLTLFRFFGALLFLPWLMMVFLPFHALYCNALVAIFFIVLGVTDFLDGYYARKFNQVTTMGALLDPLADKVFVMASLVSLVAIGKIYFYWAVFFIAREFFVMGVRECALHQGFTVPVAYSGKMKTAVQMVWLTYIILNPYQALGSDAPWWNGGEAFLLISSFALSLLSAVSYFCKFKNQVQKTDTGRS